MKKRFSLLLMVFALASQVHAQQPLTSGQPVVLQQPLSNVVVATQPAVVLSNDSESPTAGGRPAIWGGGEYLLWWVRDGHTPPLVTTGNPNDAVPGALGQPGTSTLFGNSQNYGTFSGMRFTLGAALDTDGAWGVEGNGFLLERRSVGFSAASNSSGTPPLYVPYFDTQLGQEGSLAVADPLFGFNGKIAVSTSTRLWGSEVNLLNRTSLGNNLNVDWLLGFRYLDLKESLNMSGNFNDIVYDVQTTYTDSFSTRNQFYGGQVGARVSYLTGPLALELTGKAALGTTHEVVDASGSIAQTGSGSQNPGTFPGGIFVQQSNQGRRSQNEFSVVPQVQAKLGYDLFNGVRMTVGYDFLYWNNVVRPGDQIDRSINTSQAVGGQLMGQASPAPLLNHSDFFAHGVSFGLELHY